MADLLKVTSNLLTGKTTQTIALEAVYDVIIQGDCLKGNWKPIISGLKVGMMNWCTNVMIGRRLQPARIAVKVCK